MVLKLGFVAALLLSLIVSCSAPKTGAQSGDHPTDHRTEVYNTIEGTPEQKLANALDRRSGVVVTQAGGRYTVKVRSGVNSFSGGKGPLFVVNGHRLGRDFGAAAQALYGLEITNIRVLKDSDASIYGTHGANGVIEIKAKADRY